MEAGDFELNEDRTEIKYEIQFHSDGSYSIVAKLASDVSVLEATLRAEEMKMLVDLSDCIHKIRSVSESENGLLIFPKVKGVSNEIRLVACAAAAYPDGFPQDAIRTKLNIADSSRDAYLNWETKESSRYLTYNPSTRKVSVSPEGIEWICKQLKERTVLTCAVRVYDQKKGHQGVEIEKKSDSTTIRIREVDEDGFEEAFLLVDRLSRRAQKLGTKGLAVDTLSTLWIHGPKSRTISDLVSQTTHRIGLCLLDAYPESKSVSVISMETGLASGMVSRYLRGARASVADFFEHTDKGYRLTDSGLNWVITEVIPFLREQGGLVDPKE